MFNLGTFLVRRSRRVMYVVCSGQIDQVEIEEVNPLCSIMRVPLRHKNGSEIKYFEYEPFIGEVYLKCLQGLSAAGWKDNIETIVSYNWNSGLVACELAKFLAAPHVHLVLALGKSRLASGESEKKVNSAWIAAEEKVFSEADCVVASSTNEAEEIKRMYPGCQSDKIACVNLGVDVDVFSPRPRSVSDHVCWSSRRFAQRAPAFS
ncbi:MAG: hypothetical protein HQL42_21065 [Alphaproteobacteria bacterium]|nr:hypothetical protein [Alphaproteobacteria bacterium]